MKYFTRVSKIGVFMQILLWLIFVGSPMVVSASALHDIAKKFELPSITQGRLQSDQVKVETYGVRKIGNSVAATNADRWHLGSNGKAITAMLGAILIEKGFLSWDTPIVEIFSDWKIHPDFSDITLKELFAHRAGITNDIINLQEGKIWDMFLERREAPSKLRIELAKAILTSPPAHDRKTFVYSNPSYIIAGAVMSKITGKSWEDLVTKYILNPLSMNTCGFGAAGSQSHDVPTQPWPHQIIENGSIRPISPASLHADNPPALGPAGTIHCSIEDWLKFAQVHLNGFNGINTPILRSSGFKYLHEDFMGQGYTSGGLIYQKRDGKTYLGHNGSNSMNFAVLVLDPASNSAFVSATNRGDRNGERGAQAAMLKMGSPDVCLKETCLLTK